MLSNLAQRTGHHTISNCKICDQAWETAGLYNYPHKIHLFVLEQKVLQQAFKLGSYCVAKFSHTFPMDHNLQYIKNSIVIGTRKHFKVTIMYKLFFYHRKQQSSSYVYFVCIQLHNLQRISYVQLILYRLCTDKLYATVTLLFPMIKNNLYIIVTSKCFLVPITIAFSMQIYYSYTLNNLSVLHVATCIQLPFSFPCHAYMASCSCKYVLPRNRILLSLLYTQGIVSAK